MGPDDFRPAVAFITRAIKKRWSEAHRLINGALRITNDHPVLVMANNGLVWVEVGDLRVGSKLRSAGGALEILSIEEVREVSPVVYLETTAGNFLARAGTDDIVAKANYSPHLREDSDTDRIDALGKNLFCHAYATNDMPWAPSARRSFDEALRFAFAKRLPKAGHCVEVGVYKGASFLPLVERFGLSRCLGIDVRNYSNLPNVVECDIRNCDERIPVRLGVNDLPSNCPESKLAAQRWLSENLLTGGLLILTGHAALDSRYRAPVNLALVFENPHCRIYQKHS
jgi:hypothetical protein